MTRLRPTHLRTRLTVWYVSVLAGLLLLAWGGTSALLFWQMRGQLDHFAIQEIETVEGLFYFEPDGTLRMHENYHNHPESKEVLERYVEVRSREGVILYRNDRLGYRSLGGTPFDNEGVGGYSPMSVRLSDGTRVRRVSRVHTLDGVPLLIRLAHSEEPFWSRLDELTIASLLVLPIILASAGLAGYALARRALSPIEQMARRAREITAESLHERLLNDDADDELGHLARVFNEMLGRLEQAFEQLRRFTSDASHELRTPLASIRSVGEVGLQRACTPEEYRDTIGSMLEEVNRMTDLVESLLTISRADAGQIRLQRDRVEVMPLVRESTGLFEVLMEEKSLHLAVGGDERAVVDGDRLFLRQALVNVLHNAIKYSPAGGTIAVHVTGEAEPMVAIEVSDSGPGIPDEDRSKIFERFYRVDKARWRESGGSGLGLAIAKWAVEANGGSIGLVNGGPSMERAAGCTFRIELPRANGQA